MKLEAIKVQTLLVFVCVLSLLPSVDTLRFIFVYMVWFGVVANYGNGVKKRKRWIEEAGDDDDDRYDQHVTEEHYRSMLKEHVQRLKSSSRESQGNHTSLMRKSNVGSYRGNGQRGRFYDADAISQRRGSYRGSAITPKYVVHTFFVFYG